MRTRAMIICGLALGLLAACDSPSPAFRGIEAREVTVAGNTYAVRLAGDQFEAARTSFVARPDRTALLVSMVLAVEAASGCTVREKGFKGDAAMARGLLECR